VDSRLCHALQCVEMSAEPPRSFCERHWNRLPPTLRARLDTSAADDLARSPGRLSGAHAMTVILAVRWLAVDEGLMPKPYPQID